MSICPGCGKEIFGWHIHDLEKYSIEYHTAPNKRTDVYRLPPYHNNMYVLSLRGHVKLTNEKIDKLLVLK